MPFVRLIDRLPRAFANSSVGAAAVIAAADPGRSTHDGWYFRADRINHLVRKCRILPGHPDGNGFLNALVHVQLPLLGMACWRGYLKIVKYSSVFPFNMYR
jgi:hypothetical protein